MIPSYSRTVSGVAISKIDGINKILLLKRTKGEFWCHVAGGIESEETAVDAIVREFAEETGIVINELFSTGYLEQFFIHESNCIEAVPVFLVLCQPDQIIELNSEHSEYKWCSVDEAMELVPYPSQRAVYEFVWHLYTNQHLNDFLKVNV